MWVRRCYLFSTRLSCLPRRVLDSCRQVTVSAGHVKAHLSVHVKLPTTGSSITASHIHYARWDLFGDELKLFLKHFSLQQ